MEYKSYETSIIFIPSDFKINLAIIWHSSQTFYFSQHFNSLYRYWLTNSMAVRNKLKELEEMPKTIFEIYQEEQKEYFKNKKAGIKHDSHTIFYFESNPKQEDLIQSFEYWEEDDTINFPNFLIFSTISMIKILFEDLIDDVSDEIIDDSCNCKRLNKNLYWNDKPCLFSINEFTNLEKRSAALTILGKDLKDEVDEVLKDLSQYKTPSFQIIEEMFHRVSAISSRLESKQFEWVKAKL